MTEEEIILFIYHGEVLVASARGEHGSCAHAGSAFVRTRREVGAHLLVIGFGTFREGLEALTTSLSAGDERAAERLVELGKLLEGGPAGPLEHFELSEELVGDAAGLEEAVEFVGPLYHQDLAKLLPAAEVAAVPSIFPGTFGLVAAEFAASGVVPFVADHSGSTSGGIASADG